MIRSFLFILFLYQGAFQANAQETFLLNDDFSNNSNKWVEFTEGDFKTKIEDGVYKLKNKSETDSYWTYQKTAYNYDTENFSVEAEIDFKKGDDSQGNGLLIGMYNDNSNYKIFYITASGYFKVAHFYSEKSHAIQDWKTSDAINKKSKNKLSVKREYNCAYFYINDKLVYTSCDFNYWGARFGILTGVNQTIEIDNFVLKTTKKNIPLVENAVSGKVKENLGKKVNSKYAELSPFISYDGKTLYFTRKGDPGNKGNEKDYDIWYSTLDDKGNWIEAKNAGTPINNTGPNAVQSVSPDNNTLIVSNSYKPDGTSEGGGLSYSNYQINGWEIPKKFDIKNFKNLNDYVDFFMTSDNTILLMGIDFGNSYGEKDIYVSFLQPDNSFSEPMNIGNTVNSVGNEFGIYLAADNKTLYFSSTGHECYGDADVFISKRLDDTWKNWSKPLNLGPEINGSEWDGAFKISAKGDYAYISCVGENSIEGSEDIYRIKLNNEAKPEPVLLIYGKALNKKTNEPLSTKITYNDLKDNKEVGIATSNTKDGSYKIILPIGKSYSFLADKQGFYSISENINVDTLKEYTEIERNLYLAPIEVGEVIRLNNIFFELNKADLKDESTAELDRLIKVLNDNPTLTIEIGGHTDNLGGDAYNITLSQNRVNSVVDYLTKKGIAKSRLSGKGYGESKPLTTNDSEQGKAQNRRVEFTILKK